MRLAGSGPHPLQGGAGAQAAAQGWRYMDDAANSAPPINVRQPTSRIHLGTGMTLIGRPCVGWRTRSAALPPSNARPADERHSRPQMDARGGLAHVAGGALLGGIVHVSATLAAPLISAGNALDRCGARCPPIVWWWCHPQRRANSCCRSCSRTPCMPSAATTVGRFARHHGGVAAQRMDAVAAHSAGRQFLRDACPAAPPQRGLADFGARRRPPERVRTGAAPPQLAGDADRVALLGGVGDGARAAQGPRLARRDRSALQRAACTPVKR